MILKSLLPGRKWPFQLITACLLLLIVSCAQKDDTYTFDSNRVGPVEWNTDFAEVENLFPGDSVVRDSVELQFGASYYNYSVYRSRDSLLLVVSPHRDSIGKIGSIRIVNGLYTTKDGLGPGSTFGEFSKNYQIGQVRSSVFRVGADIKDEKFQLIIPRSELPENLRLPAAPVDAVEIPDDAKVEFITISW
jgi:hypothetical protein